MSTKFPKYSYKGYTADFNEEPEYGEDGPDNVKIYHWVIPPNGGKEITIDWSPYSIPTFDEFKLWIDLGCPDRFDRAFGEQRIFFPLDGKDLQTIKYKRWGDGAIRVWAKGEGYNI